jgi:hypothetical protein
MKLRWIGVAVGLAGIAACAPGPDTGAGAAPGTVGAGQPAAMAGTTPLAACEPVERMPVEGRASPFDSAMIALNGAQAKICYGRPAVRGRQVFGGLVPYDTLWRTGANEPTIIHLPVAASIAGINLQPGSYSLYTVPGQQQWTVIVNRSITQWGHEGQYTAEVRAQEVGRARVPAERTQAPVEQFTIRGQGAAGATAIVMEWENTRVRIPIRRT